MEKIKREADILKEKVVAMAKRQGIDLNKPKPIYTKAFCPSCMGLVEFIKDDVMEIFTEKTINTSKSVYPATTSQMRKRIAGAEHYELEGDRGKTHQVKRAVYKYLCVACNSVYSDKVVLTEVREDVPF